MIFRGSFTLEGCVLLEKEVKRGILHVFEKICH